MSRKGSQLQNESGLDVFCTEKGIGVWSECLEQEIRLR